MHSIRRAPRALVGAALLLAAGISCQRHPVPAVTRTSGDRTGTSASPVIDSLRPSLVDLSGDTPADLVIHGRGFDGRGNEVAIGALVLPAVPSAANGRRIVVRVPDRVPGRGEAPPTRWMAGRYPVLISVGGRRSDTAWVEVKP
jgi:hypothetical protein